MRYDDQNVQRGEGVAPCSDVVFEGLFRGNLAAMAISDADDHRFADVNAAFLEKLGYARGEVLGKTGADLGIIADVEQWRRGMEDLIRSGNIRNRPVVIRRLGSLGFSVTFSCGIADASEFARDAITAESLLLLADARLYAAKDAGRNRCVGP